MVFRIGDGYQSRAIPYSSSVRGQEGGGDGGGGLHFGLVYSISQSKKKKVPDRQRRNVLEEETSVCRVKEANDFGSHWVYMKYAQD